MATKKKRTAAQIAATKRMVAANKARRAGQKTTTTAKRKPAAKRPAAKRPDPLAKAPAHRHHAVATKKPAKKRSVRHTVKHYADHGIEIGMGLVHDVVIPVGVGAVSAAAVDVAYGYARKWMPDTVANSGWRHLIKVGTAVGLAWGAQKAGVPGKYCKAAAIGVGIVEGHRFIEEQIKDKVDVTLDGLGMTVGQLASIIPGDASVNGLEALGALASGDRSLGAAIPYLRQAA